MASPDLLETKAKEAFIDDHFELAVDLYSQAITLSPNNAELFADRAQANIKLGNLTEAVSDANKAIELEPSLAKAYWRKGTACIKLEEYQTAKAALEAGATLAPGDARFTNSIKECIERIAEEEAEGSLKESTDTAIKIEAETASKDLKPAASSSTTTKPKYRHEFYQKPEEVVVTVFAKGIPKNNVTVNFGEQILSVTIDVPGEDAYVFQPRLFGKIVPSKCRFDVLSTKVEIRLAKAEPIQWTSLEFNSVNAVVTRVNVPSAQRPAYPSSKAKKDWDRLEAEVKKEEKNEKLDGDAALNKFFRDIYGDADEDTRRAMMKSFTDKRIANAAFRRGSISGLKTVSHSTHFLNEFNQVKLYVLGTHVARIFHFNIAVAKDHTSAIKIGRKGL